MFSDHFFLHCHGIRETFCLKNSIASGLGNRTKAHDVRVCTCKFFDWRENHLRSSRFFRRQWNIVFVVFFCTHLHRSRPSRAPTRGWERSIEFSLPKGRAERPNSSTSKTFCETIYISYTDIVSNKSVSRMIPDSRLIPREVKALVFDCDGTLVDTMPIHWRAWCKICKETGLVFRKTDFYTLAGVPGKKIINVLAKQQGIKLDPSDAYNRKREYFLEGLKTVTAIQCVVRFAEEAHKMGLPTAVASGSSRAQVLKGTYNKYCNLYRTVTRYSRRDSSLKFSLHKSVYKVLFRECFWFYFLSFGFI